MRRYVAALLVGAAFILAAPGGAKVINTIAGADGHGGGGATMLAGNAPAAYGGAAQVLAGSGSSGHGGGYAQLVGGSGDDGNTYGAEVTAVGGTVAGDGRVVVYTDGQSGHAGQTLVSDGVVPPAGNQSVVWGGVETGAGAPTAAPKGFLPLYRDTLTGGLYEWDSGAWHGPYAVAP